MKKIISVLLAAIMLMSCFAVASSAAIAGECNCGPGVHTDEGYCSCCVYCPNPNISAFVGCVDKETRVKCCADCTGLYPCTCGSRCGCTSCVLGSQSGTEGDSTPILTPGQQETVVDTFQALLKKISDFFDDLFDKIFEFLKVDEVLGNK